MLLGLNNVTDILERAADDLNVAVGRRLRGGQGEGVDSPVAFLGIERDKILRLLEAYRDRKDAGWADDQNDWQEELVLVGFSDGATLLWEMFNSGCIQEALAARRGPHAGQPYRVAFVGLVDMVRQHLGPLDWLGDDLNRPDRRLRLDDSGVILAGRNYYQQDPGGWKGTAMFCCGKEGDGTAHPRFLNVLVPDASHGGSVLPNRKAILQIPSVQAGLQRDVVTFYRAALETP